MKNYDLTPLNEELKKALDGNENNLKVSIDNLITQFQTYETEVVNLKNISLATDLEIEKLRSAVEKFTKAIELIKQVLNSSGTNDDKIEMLTKVLE